ncbi:MAG: DUF5681 domain-containing protein [Rhizomicrobium sp.]
MTKFAPGKSGNPRGRPKGSRNLAAQIMAEVNATADAQQVSKLEAAIKALVDKAVSGDQHATQLVIDRVERAEATLREAVERGTSFSDADREVIAEIHRRLQPASSA